MKSVTAQTLKEWVDKDQAIIIDVREPAEYQSKHIKGSKLIPVGEMDITKLPETDKKIVVHCFGGKRGGTACQKLASQDEDLEVYNLEGGLSAWEKAGFEVEISGSGESANFCAVK